MPREKASSATSHGPIDRCARGSAPGRVALVPMWALSLLDRTERRQHVARRSARPTAGGIATPWYSGWPAYFPPRDVSVMPADGSRGPELSVVMPCLNEAETLGGCVEKARRFLEENGIEGE